MIKPSSLLYEWLSVVIKQSAVIDKNKSLVKCCCEEWCPY